MSEHPSYVTLRRHGPDDHVAELVLDRPDAMNAISTDMALALTAAATTLAADPTVRAVVITSSHPRAFCVGADLKERHTFTDTDLMRQRPVTRAAYRSVLDLPMPAIAAIDGYALGGGYEIALSCDTIVASSAATIGLPEVSVGVIPGGGGTQLLTRRVGAAAASLTIFTAARIDATRAHQQGLIDMLTEPGAARDTALALARDIAGHSPVATRHAKKALRMGMSADLPAGLEIEDACWRATANSPDRAEGVAAFVEKRPPRWPGA
ncbi:Short-chain-enoyl-CoA hydratase [Austwickia sp. TVS 96-490-7B]|uniref:enoyl-CoA hydratase/isomerase family protein n=1 Tax=Austwickia sp. TVS 96-490-7B TaxID=2830843 RepID=UPI001D7C9D1E|nr:enoyl-CoA hydratase-related protein [Austwickia sp. TVS 96-490-7B]MBW3085372.1 Short-chain-enoyl-CoA hydratase [Austwickia sp. TVS 96-490-7B]